MRNKPTFRFIPHCSQKRTRKISKDNCPWAQWLLEDAAEQSPTLNYPYPPVHISILILKYVLVTKEGLWLLHTY